MSLSGSRPRSRSALLRRHGWLIGLGRLIDFSRQIWFGFYFTNGLIDILHGLCSGFGDNSKYCDWSFSGKCSLVIRRNRNQTGIYKPETYLQKENAENNDDEEKVFPSLEYADGC